MSAGTTPRAVRVPDDLWQAAQAAAESNGETVSDVIRRALTRYVAEGGNGRVVLTGVPWVGGTFDGVAYYERVLTPDEMAKVAHRSLPPKQSGD